MRRAQKFYEVGDGKLAAEAQQMFEEIQSIAMCSKQKIEMTLKIAVMPPPDGDKFGRTQYALTHTQPISKSIQFTTEYEGGVIITDSESIERLLQLEMFPNKIPESEKM
jgi:hypothetical protein